jgi:protein-L-isoaspartate(D-aspartate) O-methyltransferase
MAPPVEIDHNQRPNRTREKWITLAARQQMVDQQIRTWEVLDPRVLAALAAVPREAFVPGRYRELAFADAPIPIGFGQSMLAPKLQGRILQALGVNAADSVLEVGTGTGYLSACMSLLGASRRIRSIFMRISPPPPPRTCAPCRMRMCDSRRAMPSIRAALGEYDAIAVTGSLPVYDARFERALRVGGRLFAVVGSAPVMDAIWCAGWTHRVDSRKPVRDRHRPVDQCHRCAQVRILMIAELSPQEFLERRAAGTDMTLLDVREDWETQLAPVPSRIVHISHGSDCDRQGELDPQRRRW